jgi:segregation and condensation protein A
MNNSDENIGKDSLRNAGMPPLSIGASHTTPDWPDASPGSAGILPAPDPGSAGVQPALRRALPKPAAGASPPSRRARPAASPGQDVLPKPTEASTDPATDKRRGVLPAPAPEPVDPTNFATIVEAAYAGGIEFLVKLAECGDIDPKDVDVIEVTDRFLEAIAAAPKENLRQSGKVLFHASVLLRMKAEALLADKVIDYGQDDFMEFDPDGAPFIYDAQKQIIAREITLSDLEKALVRRTNNKQNRQRRVTLDQLVQALKEAEKIEKARRERKPKARIQLTGYQEVRDVDDILDLAHDEDIEVTIFKVERIVQEELPVGKEMTLVDLIKKLGKKRDWVDAFLAILFLSNTGKIYIDQKTFYGPLFIQRGDPAQVQSLVQAE